MTIYRGIAGLVWFLAFIGLWIYCIDTYGFMVGGGLGWFPSAIGASVIAALWPLWAAGIVWAVLQ